MKKVILLFSIFSILVCNISNAHIFVDSTATGANNGMTWPDAFLNLQDALLAAQEGDTIYVAQGTYTPDPLNGNLATFLIDKNLVLQGGFQSGGDSLDPAIYQSILSGDLNGDDGSNNFDDNVMTILTIEQQITNATLIDGFILRGGYANGEEENGEQNGGAIYSEGAPIIRNCRFEQNFAYNAGGAMQKTSYMDSGVVKIEDCEFINNRARSGGAINAVSASFEFRRCLFLGNTAIDNRAKPFGGALEIFLTNDISIIDSCTFENNQSECSSGAINILSGEGSDSSSIEINACLFMDNIAQGSNGVGGALSLMPKGKNSSYSVMGSNFQNNESGCQGGAVYLDMLLEEAAENTNIVIDNCSFEGNGNQTTCGSGVGLFSRLNGSNTNLVLSNSTFSNNTTYWGGNDEKGVVFIRATGEDSDVEVEVINNTFSNNSTRIGGGLSIGSLPDAGDNNTFFVRDCSFENNQATLYGGALELYGESPVNITVDNCSFKNNSAFEGGGIFINTNHSNFSATIKNCILDANNSPNGAASVIRPFTEVYGIAQEAQITFENCLIHSNGEVGEHAIEVNNTGKVGFINCTIANNNGNGLFLKNGAKVTLQNTILFNPGYDEYVHQPNVIFTSAGGNIFGDTSLIEEAEDSDFLNVNPQFIESENSCNYYQLSHSSIAINNGINLTNADDFDLCGRARIQYNLIDVGAFESPYETVAIASLITRNVSLFPNPTSGFLKVEMPENISSPAEISILDFYGRLLGSQVLDVNSTVNVEGLPVGVYLMKIDLNNQVYTGTFVKQ